MYFILIYAKYARFMASPVLITQRKMSRDNAYECKGIFRLDICKLGASATRGCCGAATKPHQIMPLLLRFIKLASSRSISDRSGQNKGRNEASPSIENPKKNTKRKRWKQTWRRLRAPKKRQRQRQHLLMKFYYAPKVIIYKFV